MEEACNNFRSYLHASGVAGALIGTLTTMYQMKDRPKNPVEFIRQNLPPAQPETIAGLTRELQELKSDIANLQKRLPKKAIEEPKPDEQENLEASENEEGIEQKTNEEGGGEQMSSGLTVSEEHTTEAKVDETKPDLEPTLECESNAEPIDESESKAEPEQNNIESNVEEKGREQENENVMKLEEPNVTVPETNEKEPEQTNPPADKPAS